MAQGVRKVLTQIIEELAAKARRYEEGEQRIRELGKARASGEEEREEQEEHVSD
jgi:hypothetical protein